MDSGLIATIVLLVAAPAGVFFVVVLVLRRVAARAERRADELRADVAARGEQWLVPLQGASYRGSEGEHGRVKGGGVLGLTDRRLLFEPIAGRRIALPVTRLVSAGTARWFRGAAHPGRPHLVIELDDGTRIGFSVRDEQAWLHALVQVGVRVEPAVTDD